MKKTVSLILVIVLAISCFAGCETFHKESDVNNAKSFSEVTQTVRKLSENGMSVEMEFTVSVKPIFDDYFTKEDFEELLGTIFTVQSDGTYGISFVIKGEAIGNDGRFDILIKNNKISDVIKKDGRAYINIKSLYEAIIGLIVPYIGEDADTSWPYDNEYLDMNSITEMMSDLNGSLYPNADMDDMGGAVISIAAALQDIVSAFPDGKLENFASKIETALVNANVLSADSEKIDIKVDKSNVKPLIINTCKVLRTDLADIVEAAIPGLKDSANIPDEMKAELDSFDKAEFQSELDDKLDPDVLETDASEIAAAFGKSHVYVTIKSDETACEFIFDMLVENTKTMYYDTISEIGYKFNVKYEEKAVNEITAPSGILTNDELTELMYIFAMGGYDDPYYTDPVINISEEESLKIAYDYWDFTPGDVDEKTGNELFVTYIGEVEEYGILFYYYNLSWYVMDSSGNASHASTVDYLYIDAETGECYADIYFGDTESA